MADYQTRDGYTFDDTANPAINTPTLARQIGQALNNGRFLQQVKCDILSGKPFFGADMDGGFDVFCTGYAAGGDVTFDSPGHYCTIIDPMESFGEGTTPQELSTAMRDRWVGITIYTIDPGALADVAPGGGGEIELSTNGIHPTPSLLSFYTASGIADRSGNSNHRVESAFSGETLIFYLHSVSGEFRMYWSGSIEIAWVISVRFGPKQNAI